MRWPHLVPPPPFFEILSPTDPEPGRLSRAPVFSPPPSLLSWRRLRTSQSTQPHTEAMCALCKDAYPHRALHVITRRTARHRVGARVVPVVLRAVDADPLGRAAVQARLPQNPRVVVALQLDCLPAPRRLRLEHREAVPRTSASVSALVVWPRAPPRARPGPAPGCDDGTSRTSSTARLVVRATFQRKMVEH